MATLRRILGKRGRTTIPYEFRQILNLKHNDVLTTKALVSLSLKKKSALIASNMSPTARIYLSMISCPG